MTTAARWSSVHRPVSPTKPVVVGSADGTAGADDGTADHWTGGGSAASAHPPKPHNKRPPKTEAANKREAIFLA
jgi:hypothetical protein